MILAVVFSNRIGDAPGVLIMLLAAGSGYVAFEFARNEGLLGSHANIGLYLTGLGVVISFIAGFLTKRAGNNPPS